MENEEPKDMPLLTAAALTALKTALSKVVIFAASQDAKWWKGIIAPVANAAALNANTLRAVQQTYGLPPMTIEKAQRIIETAPFEIQRAKDKAAQGDAPQVQARYAAAFNLVMNEAIAYLETNVPQAAPQKKWFENPMILVPIAATAFFLIPKILKR